MIRTITTIILIITTLVFFSSTYGAYSYFWYIEEPVNARSIGLGSAGTASSTGGFSYYNPAAVVGAESSFVSLDFGKRWDLAYGSVETAWIFEKWFFSASVQTQSQEFKTSDITRVLGSAFSRESMLSLFAGWKKDRYTIAAGANGLFHSIFNENAFALSPSGGITISVLPGKLDVGAAVLHAGRYHKGFSDSTYSFHRDSMATSVRAGIFWRDTVLKTLPVSLSTDIVYSRNYERVIVPVGIEIIPIEPLALRIGKRFNWEYEVMSFGIGLAWENINFDFAMVPTTIEKDIDTKWLIGLRYSLPRIKKSVDNQKTVTHQDSVTITPQQPTTVPVPDAITDTSSHRGDDSIAVSHDRTSSDMPPHSDSLDHTTTVSDTDSVSTIDTEKNTITIPNDSSSTLPSATTATEQNTTQVLPIPEALPSITDIPASTADSIPSNGIPEKKIDQVPIDSTETPETPD